MDLIMAIISFIFVQLGFSVSNWQKVQLNTDLLKQRRMYWYTMFEALIETKWNQCLNEFGGSFKFASGSEGKQKGVFTSF